MITDYWIVFFASITVIGTLAAGFISAGKAKTTTDFFVAGRTVSVGWNSAAISGEYLSAASFMGIAGMVMSNGYDALWYPVCYACAIYFYYFSLPALYADSAHLPFQTLRKDGLIRRYFDESQFVSSY